MFAAIFLLVVVVCYRVASGFLGSNNFEWLHNFAPLFAIAVCGAVYLPRRIAAILPVAMLLVSDLVLNLFHYHEPFFTLDILPRYLALALVTALAFAQRGKANLLRLVLTSMAGSVIFFLISNTGSWLYDPRYAKTAAGLLQAMTTGIPGYPPTWWFFRYTLASDVFFTLLFVACMSGTFKGERQATGTPALARS